MFEIAFLGTSASAPSVHRGLSSQLIMHDEHRFLVDCGEGTQRQILRSGLGFRRLDKFLLTHGHLDHILGLGGLLSTLARWEALNHIEIWGGHTTLARVSDLLFGVVWRGARPPVEIDLHVIEKPGPIFEDDTFTLSAFEVQHRGPGCYGYCFEEKERRPFLNERAEALNVPRGPERGELASGNNITLPDGTVITPDEVLGEATPGTKLCLTGDVARPENLVKAISRADLLISEATYLSYEEELAARFGHITAQQAAELANSAAVKNLILTHVSRRYRERDVLEEVRTHFPQAEVARDFDHFQIRQGQPLERVLNES